MRVFRVGLHQWPPVSLSQDKVIKTELDDMWFGFLPKRDQQRTRQSEDYCSKLQAAAFACNLRHALADNVVCSEHILGEAQDLVFNFV